LADALAARYPGQVGLGQSLADTTQQSISRAITTPGSTAFKTW